MLCGAGMLRVQLERRSQAWMVRSRRVELPRGHPHSALNAARPPVPPRPRDLPTHGTHVQLDERIGTRAVDQACSCGKPGTEVRRCYGVCRSSLLAGPKRPR